MSTPGEGFTQHPIFVATVAVVPLGEFDAAVHAARDLIERELSARLGTPCTIRLPGDVAKQRHLERSGEEGER